MEKVRIVVLAVEGGGVVIYGHQVDGKWCFWKEGASIDFDENVDEAWREFSSKPVSELAELLPHKFCNWYPMEVHPEFVAYLTKEYYLCLRDDEKEEDRCLSNVEREEAERHLRRAWDEFLSGGWRHSRY